MQGRVDLERLLFGADAAAFAFGRAEVFGSRDPLLVRDQALRLQLADLGVELLNLQ